MIALCGTALLTGCMTTSSALFSKTDTDTRPRVTKGSLLTIDLRSAEQIAADNSPFANQERTTGSFLESIPIVGPVIEGIISVTKGKISLGSYETWYEAE